MSVTKKDVEHIAKLAHLEFTEHEMEKFTHQMNQILDHMQQLNKLDTADCEPLSHVIELHNVFREDVVKQSITTEEALKNAPSANDGFFKVPKVIGERE